MATHPRRRYHQRFISAEMLRKSDTFNARTDLTSDLYSPLDSAYTLRRSPTTLDVLLNRSDDYHSTQRANLEAFLQSIEDCINKPSLDDGIGLVNQQEMTILPAVHVEQATSECMLDDEKKNNCDHHHDSDSGLGTSIGTFSQAQSTLSSTGSVGSSISIHSAITRSFGTGLSLSCSDDSLSIESLGKIQEQIFDPILSQDSLKDFHPLVKQIPDGVNNQQITNLRDIEKTLLYASPVFSTCATAFRRFWDFTIRCLHATVDLLPDRDQRRQSDRPYTNSYFLDLVEQVRRHAEIMRRTREKQERGEALDEMDFSADEKISLQGGLTNNGKFAQLIQERNGKTMPLIPEDSSLDMAPTKRSHHDHTSDGDDAVRSMARRRKSDKVGDIMHMCTVCSKAFKRPCDLTKHEKTHSRPFKCIVESCRYFDLGWPTEKERDRHMNDKHSSVPKMYHCMFPPCSYSSKRESNCKQHMEKAHGWQYIRSKSNGRKKDGSTSGSTSGSSHHTPVTPATPYTPLEATPLIATPSSHFTSEGSASLSPCWLTDDTFSHAASFRIYSMGTRPDSITTSPASLTFSSGFSPTQGLPSSKPLDFGSVLFSDGSLDMDFNMNNTICEFPAPHVSGPFGFDMNFMTGGTQDGCIVQQSPPNGHGDAALSLPPNMFITSETPNGIMSFADQDFLLYPMSTRANNLEHDAALFSDPEQSSYDYTQFDSLVFDSSLTMFPR